MRHQPTWTTRFQPKTLTTNNQLPSNKAPTTNHQIESDEKQEPTYQQPAMVERLAVRTLQRLRKLFPSAAALRWQLSTCRILIELHLWSETHCPNFDSYQISWTDPHPLFSQAVHLSGCGKLHEGSHGGSLQVQVPTTTLSSWDAPCWCWDWSSHEGIERVRLLNRSNYHIWLFLHTLSSGWTYSPNERVPQWSSNRISKRVQTIEQDQQKSRKVSYPLLPWPLVLGRQIQNLLKRNLWRVWG